MPSWKGLSNLEIRCLVEELEELRGCYFKKIQDLGKGFKIKFTGHELIVIPPKRFHLTQYSYQATRPSNFSMYVRKRLKGRKVQAVEQAGFDRVLFIDFENGFRLVFEMFAKGNTILVKDGNTIRALHYQSWKDREIKTGKPYSFPTPRGLNPLEMTREKFARVFDQKDVIRSLAKNINMSGKYLEEACYRAGVDKEKEETTTQEKEELFKQIKKMLEERKPGIQGEPVALQLRKSKQEFQPKPSLNQALDEYYSPEKKTQEQESPRIAKLKHRLEEQEKGLKRLREKKKEDKQKGDLIYLHIHQLRKLFQKIQEMREQGKSWEEINHELKGTAEVKPETQEVKVKLEPLEKKS